MEHCWQGGKLRNFTREQTGTVMKNPEMLSPFTSVKIISRNSTWKKQPLVVAKKDVYSRIIRFQKRGKQLKYSTTEEQPITYTWYAPYDAIVLKSLKRKVHNIQVTEKSKPQNSKSEF